MRSVKKFSCLPLLVLPIVACLGCGAPIAWLVAQFAPPQKIEPVYEFPKNKKVLVFVDDLLNPVSYIAVKNDLTKKLNRQLTEHGIVKDVISYDRLMDLKGAMPKFNQLAISEVGNKLGADVVLYVQIDKFSLKDDEESPLWHGNFEATIRMVDVDKGRLWPKDRPSGYPVEPVKTPTQDNLSTTYGSELASQLATMMADKIAKLFYEHEVTVHTGWE